MNLQRLLINMIYIGSLVICKENYTLTGFLSVVREIVRNVSSQNVTSEIKKNNQSEDLEILSKHSLHKHKDTVGIDIQIGLDKANKILCDKCGCGPGRCGGTEVQQDYTLQNALINNLQEPNMDWEDFEDAQRGVRCGCGGPGRCGNQLTDGYRQQNLDDEELCSVRCGCGRPARSNPTTNSHEKNTGEIDDEFCSVRCGCGKPGRCGNQNNFDKLIDDVDAQLQREGYVEDVEVFNDFGDLFNIPSSDKELDGKSESVRCGCRTRSEPGRCDCILEATSNFQNIYELLKDPRTTRNKENKENPVIKSYPIVPTDNVNIINLHDPELSELLRSFVSVNHKITKFNKGMKPNLLKALVSEIYNLDKTKSSEKQQHKNSRIMYAPQEIARLYNQFKDKMTVRILNYIKNITPKKDLPYLTLKSRKEFNELKNQYKKKKLNDSELKQEIIDMLIGKKGNIRIVPHKQSNNKEIIIPSWLYTALYKMRSNHKNNSYM